jgi:SAM-dependent methyltransferase
VLVSVHDLASHGFDRGAAAYERGRPDYPLDAVEWIVANLGITAGRTVIDLGAGTGKFTRLLVPTGARVIAVEPVAGMRHEFQRAMPGVSVLKGTAQAIPLPSASADAVTAAQAFHWFATRESLDEIHRVLREGGGLGLIWNRRDQRDPLQATIETMIRPYRGRAPAHERDRWRDAMQESSAFGLLGERRFSHRQTVDRDGLLDRVASTSFIASLAEAERVTVLNAVAELVAGQARIVLPYVTDVFIYRRL